MLKVHFALNLFTSAPSCMYSNIYPLFHYTLTGAPINNDDADNR